MSWKRKILVCVGLILVFLLVVGCSGNAEETTVTDEPQLVISPIVSATGIVNPEREATLSVASPGIVDNVLVERGDLVSEGDVLVRLKGLEEVETLITEARTEVVAAKQAREDLDKNHDFSLAASMQAYYQANIAVKEAKYTLDNFTIPSNQKNLDAVEGVRITREKLEVATEAFEPYRNESQLNDTREELKDRMDEAQADYNSAIKRLTYELSLAEAEARLAKAQRDYDTLLKGPDPDQVALAEARLETANAALAAAEKRRADLEIKALFDGTVSEIIPRAGEWVAPGQPVVIIADLEDLRVETTDLNEIDVARVQVGDKVNITFDALPELSIVGKVTLISPKSSAGSGVNYTVIIEMESIPPELRWGMTAFVDIEVRQ